MSTIYTSGSLTTASAINAPVFEAPFRQYGVNTSYILRQVFMQKYSSFTPLAIGTSHSEFTDFELVEETPLEDTGIGGMARWTRVYAKTPDSFSVLDGTINYLFIGFVGSWGINVTTVTGRDRFARTVNVLRTREFTKTPGTLGSVAQTRYYYTGNLDVDWIADSPPLVSASTPSKTTYEGWITADAANTNPFDPAGYSIVVESSRYSVWMGDIYMRETSRIKAL